MDLLAPEMSAEADRESDGFLRGLAVATVTNNQDPEGLARVRVRLPWQPESQESYWARLVVPMALAEQGTYFLPEVGSQVLCGFEMGDLTHPCVLGCLWNTEMAPPDSNDDGQNNIRKIKTRSDSELCFFDGEPPSLELKLSSGKRLFMDDTTVVLEDENGNKFEIDSSANSVKIISNGDLCLEGMNVKIDAGASMDISASGTMTIQGAMVQIN